MELLGDYGLFLAKAVTFLFGLLILISAIAGAIARGRRDPEAGRLDVRHLNERLEGMRDVLRHEVMDSKSFRKLVKREAKQRKAQRAEKRARIWVLRFEGDLEASAVEQLRHEVTAILTLAEEGDEVVACIESPGGMVHGYGLAASQLDRIRQQPGVRLTVAIDKVAASGGYMMACLGERIIAAPFALVGSIGVVAQIPNVHRLLKRNDIDVEVLTAGEYKRTLTVLGENTEAGRAKFVEELEDIHALFKEYVGEARPALDMARVATGEAWYGTRALELGLVDELQTSDAYLSKACEQADVYEVTWSFLHSPMERFLQQGSKAFASSAERLWLRWRDSRTWLG